MEERRIEDAYRRYLPMIRAKCRRIGRNDLLADDLAQETFMRLWEARETLREPDAVLSWLYRTATRLAIDASRRGRFELVGIPDDQAIRDSREPSVAYRIDAMRLSGAIGEDHLEVALLTYVDGMTQVEVARATDRSDRTVRRMLDRIATYAEQERRST